MPFCQYTALEVNIVSAKAYEALSKSNELTAANETAQSPTQKNDSDEKERKKRLKGSLIKFGSLAVFAFVVWIFATIAWFSQNDSVSAGGMGVGVDTQSFELQITRSNQDTIGYSSLYSTFSSLLGEYGSNTGDTTSSSNPNVRWSLSSEDKSLRPGSRGVLHFKVITDDDIVPNYSIELKAYSAVITVENNNGTPVETPTSMNSMARGTGGNITVADYLNAHILFFKGYDNVNDRYYGFISDPSDFQLTLDANNETDIYWIWPRTFGQLVLTDSNEDSQYTQGGAPVLDKDRSDYNTDKNAVYSYISGNLNTMFKAPTVTAVDYSGAFTDMQSKRTAETDYNAEYSTLSTGYNTVDQEIGKNIRYCLVVLTATA